MSEMNEVIEEVVSDAEVMTVPIDDTLTVSGEAADAKAVGDALALKADLNQVTGISVNGEHPDAQGAIIIDASEVPMTEAAGAKSVAEMILEGAARTAEDIAMGEEDDTTIADAIADTVKITAQELTAEEQQQARENIGAPSTAEIEWSLTGNQVIGTTAVVVPEDAREYLVVVRYATAQAMQTLAFQFNIPASAPSGLTYSDGYYIGPSSYAFAQVMFSKGTPYSIQLTGMNINGADYSSTSIIYVWYR